MKCSIQRGKAELNGAFHLSPHENICTIALINIHYLYNKVCVCFNDKPKVLISQNDVKCIMKLVNIKTEEFAQDASQE